MLFFSVAVSKNVFSLKTERFWPILGPPPGELSHFWGRRSHDRVGGSENDGLFFGFCSGSNEPNFVENGVFLADLGLLPGGLTDFHKIPARPTSALD